MTNRDHRHLHDSARARVGVRDDFRGCVHRYERREAGLAYTVYTRGTGRVLVVR